MTRTLVGRFVALAVLLVVAAGTALPAAAAPADPGAASILDWCKRWISRLGGEAPERAILAAETLPNMDPNGLNPASGQPEAEEHGSTTDDGETLPNMDPDG